MNHILSLCSQHLALVVRFRWLRPVGTGPAEDCWTSEPMTGTNSRTIRVTASDDFVRDIYESPDNVMGTALPSNQSGESMTGRDISLSFPVRHAENLHYLTHLEQQLSSANQSENLRVVDNSSQGESMTDGEIFDLTVIQILDRAFEAEGKSIEDISIKNQMIRSGILYEIWDMDSWPQLARHLEDSESVRAAIGFESTPDQSTFNRKLADIDDDTSETIRAVAIRAVHASFRSGITIPQQVIEKYNLSSYPELGKGNYRAELKQMALLNWIEFLLNRVFEEDIFDRSENQSYSSRQVIGALALGAMAGSLNGIQEYGRWYYNEEEIPTSRYIRRLLGNMDMDDLMKLFDASKIIFVNATNDLGFFNTPRTLALDTTWLDVDGEIDARMAINKPEESGSDQGWLYTAVHIANQGERFTPGLNLVTDKSEKASPLRKVSNDIRPNIDINWLLADRGFYRSDAVSIARDVAKKRWLIRVKHKKEGDVARILDDTPQGNNKFVRNVNFGSLDLKPNLYIRYVPELAEKWETGHVGFLTDLNPELCGIDRAWNIYRKRWSVETYFDQLKNHFSIPSKSRCPELRFFLLQFQSLLYNFHTLINRSLSPKLGIQLDVRHFEVLQALVDSTFSRRESGLKLA